MKFHKNAILVSLVFAAVSSFAGPVAKPTKHSIEMVPAVVTSVTMKPGNKARVVAMTTDSREIITLTSEKFVVGQKVRAGQQPELTKDYSSVMKGYIVSNF